MKIKYKTRNLTINLILGLVWLVWFFLNVFFKESPGWTDYGWGVMSLLYLVLYFYQRKNQYLLLENGYIKYNFPFGNKLKLEEVKSIRSFAGDYILKTGTKDFTIHPAMIDPNSLAELEAELEKLQVPWT